METMTNNQTSPTTQSGAVDYAAALRQYNRYGHGRSMKKFCEDEGYDYWKFCKLAREGQIEMGAKSGTDRRTGFIEVNPDGTQSQAMPEEPMKVCEIRIRLDEGRFIRPQTDITDEELAKLESPPENSKKRSACLVHIRRLFVNALEENFDEAMWRYRTT